MQFRCASCTRTIALAASGDLPLHCPHCNAPPGPGPLGPYEPRRLIAAGGMGEVWLARHRELGTEVAVKVLPAMPLDAIGSLRERFAREARLTARIHHPGVVKVHGHDTAGDRPYLVLEFVAGATLRDRMRAGPLPFTEAARIAAATADVLAAAHAEGVLHRDVKPDNVMLEPDGTVRVLDFGIARAIHDDAPLTRTGDIVGTPEYMAPEQLVDGPEATTARTDVHALGVLTYELLTNRSPFHGASVFAALKLVESLVPPPPSRLCPHVPAALDAAVERALAKDPDDRFATAAEFAAAVRAAVPHLAAAGPRSPSWRWWLLAAGLLVAAIGVVAVLLPPLTPAPTRPAAAVHGAASAERRAAIARSIADGQWTSALVAAERLVADGDGEARELAREAFALHRFAWVFAAGAPEWLSWSDEGRRARWFPIDGEAGIGDPWRARRQRLAGDDATVGDTAAANLLRIRSLPRHARSDALATLAQGLPIDSAEHWLAHMLERHLRGDHDGGTQAAEMAWLHGAGELAVLLDAWSQIAPPAADAPLRRLDPAAATRLRARVARGAGADAPASGLLTLLLGALHGQAFEAAFAPIAGLPDAAVALQWFRAAATQDGGHDAALADLATRLGAEGERGR